MIKKCPRCGSKNIKKEIKIESNLPGMLTYCVDCKTRIKWEDWLGGMPPSQSALEDKEWDRYQEEFTFNQPPYFKYLWIKNTQNEISLDISSRNIERCEKFYNENPHDKDGLYRIMILKVALGEETKELLDKFLEATAVGNGAYNFLTGLGEGVCDDSRFLEALNPYLPNIKKFLIWFLEKNPGAIRNSNFSKDWEELFYLIPICEIVGIQAIFELLDIDSLLSDRVVIVGEEEDLVIAAYAEFCYKEKRWFDALRVYELLLNKEKINPVGVGYDYSFLEYFSDLMSDYPTIEKIQGRCLECLKKAAEGQDCSRIFDLLFKRLELIDFQEKSLKRKEEDIEIYLKIYTIFQEVINSNYAAACNIWKDWEDKKDVKFIGLKQRAIEEYLNNLKEGKGDKKSNLKKFFENSLIEDFALISDCENKIKEFIITNLIKFYRTKKDAWFYGVPEKIRIEASRKQQQQRSLAKMWDFFEFSDYPEIIKANGKIFRAFFIMDKADNQKKQEELFGFLDKIVPLRNNVSHQRILSAKERIELRNYHNYLCKIYANWRKLARIK